MTIAVDVTVLERACSGVGRAMLGLYDACVRIDPTLELVGIHRSPLACILPSHFRDVQWGGWLPGRVWRKCALSWYLRRKRPEVVHFPCNNVLARPRRASLTVLTLCDVIPLALPNLYFESDDQREAYRTSVQRSLDRADLVLTISECSKRDILRYLEPPTEPIVVYLAPAPPSVQEHVDEPPSMPYYLYLGGYEKRKGLDQLVRVYHRLFATGRVNCPLIVVGKPNHDILPGFREDIQEAVAAGAVIEKGYVDDGQLVRLLKGARALVFPSRYEGFGFPPLEAMSVGCPVITTNVSSMPEICGDAPLYVSADQDEELARAILTLDRHPEYRRTLVAKGFEQVKRFNWETSARKYLSALRQLLTKEHA